MTLFIELLAFLLIFVLPVAIMILPIVGMWGVFKKAGEKGWKVLIPFYNTYTMLRIGGKRNYIPLFWIANAVSILSFAGYFIAFGGMLGGMINSLEDLEASILMAEGFMGMILSLIGCWIGVVLNFIVNVQAYAGICTKMEQDGAMTVGLVMLPPVFWMVLGYSTKIQWQYDVSIDAFYGNDANNEADNP